MQRQLDQLFYFVSENLKVYASKLQIECVRYTRMIAMHKYENKFSPKDRTKKVQANIQV